MWVGVFLLQHLPATVSRNKVVTAQQVDSCPSWQGIAPTMHSSSVFGLFAPFPTKIEQQSRARGHRGTFETARAVGDGHKMWAYSKQFPCVLVACPCTQVYFFVHKLGHISSFPFLLGNFPNAACCAEKLECGCFTAKPAPPCGLMHGE